MTTDDVTRGFERLLASLTAKGGESLDAFLDEMESVPASDHDTIKQFVLDNGIEPKHCDRFPVLDEIEPAYWRELSAGSSEYITRRLVRHGPSCDKCSSSGGACAVFKAMRVVEKELTGF